MNVFYVSLAATLFFTTASVFCYVTTRRARLTAHRISDVVDRNYTVRAGSRGPGVLLRLFSGMHWLRRTLRLSHRDELARRLAGAGYKGAFAAETYNTARFFLPILGLMAALLIPFAQLFWVMSLPAIGFLAPNFVLTRMIKRRRDRIRRSIPDTVDLLVICVDAGLGIDQALLRVSQELGISHPQITEELLQINGEQRAGKPRIQAWADMAKRSELEDLDAFAGMLAQTERFGTPISRALSTFADTIRLRRRQLAEQMAARTTVKIIFPLVLCIFPSMFIVILAPAILSIMRSMADMSR